MNKRLQEIPMEVASLSSTYCGHEVVDRADAPIDVLVSRVFCYTVALRYDSALAPSLSSTPALCSWHMHRQPWHVDA